MTPKIGDLSRAAGALVLLLVFGTGLPAWGAPQPVGPAPAGAQAPDPEGRDPLTLKEAGREFLSDMGRIWSSPARIKSRHLVPLFALAATTAFLIASDESIRDGVQSYAQKHAWVGDVSPVITQMGGLAGFATAGAFFGAGLIFKNDRARDTGYLAASAMLQSILVDNVLKAMTGRRRPYVADGEDYWGGPAAVFKHSEEGAEAYKSFPSGHAANAFALATVVSLQYRRSPWVSVLAYTLATGVGLSRMAMDLHWASDVLVGTVVGHLVGRLVVRNHTRRQRLVPTLACTGRGVALSIFWDLDPAGL